MHLNLPHKLSQTQAVEKVQKMLSDSRAQIAEHATITHEEWEGNKLHFTVDLSGKTITGTLEVTDTEYVVDATLPILWRMFEGKIEAEVRKHTSGLL